MKAARTSGAAARSPWGLALMIALGGHGAAMLLASRLAWAPRLAAERPFVPEPIAFQIELVDETARSSAGSSAATTATATPGSAPIDPARGGEARSRAPGGDGGKRDAAFPDDGEKGPGSGEYDPLPGPRSLPGLGGVAAWSLPGVLAPLPPSAPAPTTIPRAPVDHDAGGRAIRGTLDARDQARGMSLPAANEAARVIEGVVASAETEGESRATFAVELGADGTVRSVALARATSGDAAIWARVVAQIKAALAGRHLTMRGDAASLGASVSIEITTRVRLPNGAYEGGIENIGAHKTKNVLSRVKIVVAGAKPLPEDIKPIVIQPFFTPPDPKKSGWVPISPAEEYRRRGGE